MAKNGQKSASSDSAQVGWKLYEAGDVVRARAWAKRVLAENDSGPEADQAKATLQRTSIPLPAWVFGGVTLTLWLILATLAKVRFGGA